MTMETHTKEPIIIRKRSNLENKDREGDKLKSLSLRRMRVRMVDKVVKIEAPL